MSNDDKKDTESTPKRRGRRAKPAVLERPKATNAEELEERHIKSSSGETAPERQVRGRGRRPAKPVREEPVREVASPVEEFVPERYSSDDEPAAPEPRNTAPEAGEAPQERRAERTDSPVGSDQPARSEGEPGAEGAKPPSPDASRGPAPGGGRWERGGQPQGGYRARTWEKPWKQRERYVPGGRDFQKPGKFGKSYGPSGGAPAAPSRPRPPERAPSGGYDSGRGRRPGSELDVGGLNLGELPYWETLSRLEDIERLAEEVTGGRGKPLDFNRLYTLGLKELVEEAKELEVVVPPVPLRRQLVRDILRTAGEKKKSIQITGIVEIWDEGGGMLVYTVDNFRVRGLSCFVPQRLMERWGLRRGHEVEALVHAPREGESCPFAVKIVTVNGRPPEDVAQIIPFTELTPYYPTERFLMETSPEAKWDNVSMRVVDLLTPVGLGQRGLIVAPPRTGKTILMQGIANAIRQNRPDVHMIILLVDERPEEVTDFRRTVDGAEVISSTFDEPAESHTHAAEMVIEKARRMVEYGRHVVILLDSITRLARAYNTMMPSSGKILSGGVEASALQKPKRFFGSARNIEGGGSLTILGTALIETGSKMDEVIFEEFKGTGNMELDLDRALSDKRIFPAMSFEKSGTRKEELLYHKDELQKIYSLRRAMKGIPSTEAMEMLITRVKKTKSNAEFLVSLNR